ncbi:MAG: hypothetical protein SV966_12515 [Actinomycetota bacterium]|nr:hypothetical protein [Actinomycetota bacterium]
MTDDNSDQWQRDRWLRRYGPGYATDSERAEAYSVYCETLATMRAVFGI